MQAYVAALGQQRGVALFSQDVMRSQPFSNASTIPDATGTSLAASRAFAAPDLSRLADAARLGRAYEAGSSHRPLLLPDAGALAGHGSNEWAISGQLTADGRPLLANDPHLAFSAPSTLYPIAIEAPGMDVEGEGFAGVPGVMVGHNRYIAWGATTNPMDVTDTYMEQVVPDAASPSRLATLYLGNPEPIIPIPETFRYNVGGRLVTANPATDNVPAATLIVPRRNNGPIIQLDQTTGKALSVQWTGFGPTFELQTFLTWDRARNLDDFQTGLQYLDVGS